MVNYVVGPITLLIGNDRQPADVRRIIFGRLNQALHDPIAGSHQLEKLLADFRFTTLEEVLANAFPGLGQ